MLTIEPHMKVSDLMRVISENFPYLRLEIYCQGQEAMSLWPMKHLHELSRHKNPEALHIQPSMAVNEIVDLFWQKMGLQVMIFRRIGSMWLETSYTGSWSLEHQNNMGSSMVSV